MNNEQMEFAVGDEVVTTYWQVGKVIRITPKAKRVVVSFGNYEERFYPDGRLIDSDPYRPYCYDRIRHITPEIKKELEDRKTIKACKDAVKRANINAEQARKILEVLEC